MSIQAEQQSLSPSGVISLFTIDLTKVGGSVMHFAQAAQAGAPVSFAGVSYEPVDCEFEGLETSAAGALPQPKIRISNIDGYAQALLNTFGEISGAMLYRIRTYTRFLDGQPDADSEAVYGPDIFRIERMTSENGVFIEWELSAAIDQEGKELPGRTAIRNTCPWRYRYYNVSSGAFDYSKAQCPYTGNKYFDINDQPVTDPAKDFPSRRLGCCRARFGKNKPLPFGGFAGLRRIG